LFSEQSLKTNEDDLNPNQIILVNQINESRIEKLNYDKYLNNNIDL
jgi:hypothetical protein